MASSVEPFAVEPGLKLPNVDHITPLRPFTTMRVGGSTRYFIRAATKKHLIRAVREAERIGLPWVVIGEGSNIIPPDGTLDALVIKNEINRVRRTGARVTAGSGTNLLAFIGMLNRAGSAGFEKMAGIPGTIGGALYGCAGAYGQEIKDRLRRVKIFDGSTSLTTGASTGSTSSPQAKNKKISPIRWISKEKCRFGYRTSIFKKKKKWVILEAEFEISEERPKVLQEISRDIIRLREQKYRPGLRCPGSFFKNIPLSDIRPAKRRREFLEKIPPTVIQYGKVPAGYLLESVGAKGMREGGIAVAEHHGNLVYNQGRGTAREIKELAEVLKKKVEKAFGIRLEEEVQYL